MVNLMILQLLWISSCVVTGDQAEAAVVRAPKQMFILRPMNNEVWGNYLFSAESSHEKGEKASFELLLPKEKIDFKAVQGLGPENIELRDQSLFFSKYIPARLELYGIDFLLQASFGKSKFSLMMPYDVPEVSVLIPKSSPVELVENSKKMEDPTSMHIGDTTFSVYRFKGNRAGDELSFVLQGIAQGRSSLWIVGWVFLGILTISAGALTLLGLRP